MTHQSDYRVRKAVPVNIIHLIFILYHYTESVNVNNFTKNPKKLKLFWLILCTNRKKYVIMFLDIITAVKK
ncbi:hypothetical protein FACS1894111_03040 [Clostridia bacterium]|nr:hypothetical protein FACS1894111_03040 [Clostridia bacterium]